jgi:competence ComEA-like helix-hairpin-helix protein
MQVDRVRNLVLICLVGGAWLAAIALDLRERSVRGATRDRACSIPAEAGSASVRRLFCTGRLPVNCATVGELELLDGVGPSRARAIAGHRLEHGAFSGPEDMEEVRGIGPVTAARLAGQISFERSCTSDASRSP